MEDSPPLTNRNKDSYNTQELLKQIDALKKVIHDKNIQLNSVIKNAEEKYHDIHKNYRHLAKELHQSWKHKYDKLEEKNKDLLNTINVMKESQEQQTKHSNNNDIGSPLSNITIDHLTESLLNDAHLNQLTGGNMDHMTDALKQNMMNGHHKRRTSKPKPGTRVIENYID